MVFKIEPLGSVGVAVGADVSTFVLSSADPDPWAATGGRPGSTFGASGLEMSDAATAGLSVPPAKTTLSFFRGSSTFKETTRIPTIRASTPRTTHFSTLPIAASPPSPRPWEIVVCRFAAALGADIACSSGYLNRGVASQTELFGISYFSHQMEYGCPIPTLDSA